MKYALRLPHINTTYFVHWTLVPSCDCIGRVSSSYVSVWISCYTLRTIWLFMWSSSCTCFEYTLVAYKHTYFVQRNRMKCGHSRNLFYVSRSCFSFYLHTFVTPLNKWNTREISFLFDIWKLLVAYKHTYFVQRNRMKCGHSRNLFYVSRSCFSFYLHTFVTHLNKWNTPWDFIFIRHLKTTCGI